ELRISGGETAIEISARSAAVGLAAAEEPALEVVGAAARDADEVVESSVVEAALFAGADARRARRRAHFDRAVVDAEGAFVALRVDRVDGPLRRGEAGALRVEPDRVAVVAVALEHYVPVAELDHRRLIGLTLVRVTDRAEFDLRPA